MNISQTDLEKKLLRADVLQKRRALTPSQVEKNTLAILKRITSLRAYQKADRVMLYMDYQNETAVSLLLPQLLAQNKTPVLPLTTEDFEILPYEIPQSQNDKPQLFTLSSMGIKEPNPQICQLCALEEIDFIIVPGVAFDRSGNRLGFGRGCYDRFLPKLRPDVLKAAAAYSFQLVAAVPVHEADVPVNVIATEEELLIL